MEKRKLLVWIAGVIVAAALPFVPSLWGGFALDDIGLIVNDPLAHSLVHLPETFTKDFLHGTLGPDAVYYRPLVTASYQANYMIAGPDPFVFRLFNLLLHVIASVMVFALARRVMRSITAAGIAGVAFGVLPAHAEAAAWISGRTDLMSCVFTLGAMLVFARSCEERAFAWPRAIGCAALTMCALLSKENALVLPLLAAGYAWIFGFAGSRADKVKWVSAFAIPLVIFVLIRRHAVHVTVVNYPTVALGRRLLGIGIAYAAYMRMMFVPMAGRVVYDVFPIGIKYPLISLAAWLVPVGLGALTVRLRKSLPAIAFGSMWMLLTLMPVSNVLPAISPVPAERFVYLASVGSAIILGWFSDRMLAWRPRSVRVWPAVGVVIVAWYALLCGPLAYVTSLQYQSNVAWSRAVSEIDGRFFRSWAGYFLYDEGRKRKEARDHEAATGLFQEAAHEYEAAIKHGPIEDAADYIGLANSWGALGQTERAVRALRAARAKSPPNAQIELQLAKVCAEAGRLGDAEEAFGRAVRLDPKLAGAWRGLGRSRLKLGKFDEAAAAYQRVFALSQASDRDRLELDLALKEARESRKGARRQ